MTFYFYQKNHIGHNHNWLLRKLQKTLMESKMAISAKQPTMRVKTRPTSILFLCKENQHLSCITHFIRLMLKAFLKHLHSFFFLMEEWTLEEVIHFRHSLTHFCSSCCCYFCMMLNSNTLFFTPCYAKQSSRTLWAKKKFDIM